MIAKIIALSAMIRTNIGRFFKRNWKNCFKSFLLFSIITYSACLLGANIGYYKYDVETRSFLPKVNFGIDIVGGDQITAVIDSGGVVDEFLNNSLESVRLVCKEQELDCKVVKEDNSIVFSFITKKQKEVIKEFRKVFNTYGLSVDVASRKDDILKLKIVLNKNYIDKIISDTTDKAISILKNRIDGVGTKEISVQRYGFDKIVILVPKGADIERIKNVINTTAKLTFNLMERHHIFVEKPTKILNGTKILEQYNQKKDNKTLYYLVEKNEQLNGNCITNVQVVNNGFDVAINFKMNKSGAKKFAEITKNNIGRLLAIVLDDKVLMAPMINVSILDGNGSITGNFSMEEANDLSVLLRSGSLPTKITIINDRQLSSMFDKNIFLLGGKASLIAFVIVAIIMMIYYKYLGFVAISALMLNFLFSFSIITIFGFTLTLPGIAGLILMLGMAIDANILIYEKMKELKRQGIEHTSILIQKGFSNALSTIIDSNLTTIIAGIALFSFGGSFIQGFSITLIIGILCSLFTAVNFSKIIIIQNYIKVKNRVLPI